jgi:hypothetical protein
MNIQDEYKLDGPKDHHPQSSESIQAAVTEIKAKLSTLEKKYQEDKALFYSLNSANTPWKAGNQISTDIEWYRGMLEGYEIDLGRAQEIDTATLRQRRQEEQAARAAIEARAKEGALHKWQKAGGDPAEFDKAWPDMWREILTRQVLESSSADPISTFTETLAR